MKKLISIILSLALVACMFAMNVGAELVVGDNDSDKALSAGDGATDIPANSSLSSNVTLNLGTVNHRYAVDITFQTMTLNVGDVTWNVNTAKYELTDTEQTKTWTITVDNYSDMGVTATVTKEDVNVRDEMSVTLDKTTLPLNAVTVGGPKTTGDVTVTADSNDWNKTINAYIKAGELTNVTIAKILVTITKTNP